MRKIIIIVFLMMTIESCKSHDYVLSNFEKKLYEHQMVKQISISQADSSADDLTLHVNRYVSFILDDKKAVEIDFIKMKHNNDKPFPSGFFTLWNRLENNVSRKYFRYNQVTKPPSIENNDGWEFELKKDKEGLNDSSWHFLISKKMVHKYNKCVIEQKFGYQWYIFSGKSILKQSSPNFPKYPDKMTLPPDNIILFEIWIREDQNVWMELYKNSREEMRIAIEGSFQVPKDELVVKEPESLDEMKKIFENSFKKSFLYKMNILKDCELGMDLY